MEQKFNTQLEGSEKQVEWAKNIREFNHKLYSMIRERFESVLPEFEAETQSLETKFGAENKKVVYRKQYVQKVFEAIDEILRDIEEETQAKKFIEEVHGTNRVRGNPEDDLVDADSPEDDIWVSKKLDNLMG